MGIKIPVGLGSDQETLSLLCDSLTSALRLHEDSPEQLWEALSQDIKIGGATIAEDYGGIGGGAAETWVIMETLGRSHAWTPYLASSVLGAGALRLAGGASSEALLPRISAGEILMSLAYLEPGRGNASEPATTIATPSDSGYLVNGAKVAALGLNRADYLVFSAHVPDRGTTLFCVETCHPGVISESYVTLDGGSAADFELRDMYMTEGNRIGVAGQGQSLLDRLIDEATAAVCAAACGTMRTMIKQTVSYCSQRQQFGKALADFQVIKHRLADMYIAVEQAASLSQLAFAKLGAPVVERQEAVSGAKYLVAEACRIVSQGAVQLHGGIGTTEELAVSRFFKRALMFEHLFGGGAYHLDRYLNVSKGSTSHDAQLPTIAREAQS